MTRAGPTIHLHIGRNKAGSTTLQTFFADNAAWLGECGIQYATFGHAEPIPGLPALPSHRDLIAYADATPRQSLLISNELIAAFSPDLASTMAADLAGRNVRVIFYVRPYADWVRSSYGFDILIGANGEDFDTYLARRAGGISFWPTLQIWGNALGWDRVRVRSTDPRDLIGGDLVTDCLAALGLPRGDRPLPPRGNVTPPWIVIELMRLVKGHDPSPRWDHAGLAICAALHQLTEESLAASGMPVPPVQYLTPEQAARLAGLYNRDVAALRAETATELQAPVTAALPERPFLPAAAHIPAEILRDVAARARARDFARVHPEVAAFVAAPPYTTLLAMNADLSRKPGGFTPTAIAPGKGSVLF